MYYFILFIKFLKTSDNQNTNPTRSNEQHEHTEKSNKISNDFLTSVSNESTEINIQKNDEDMNYIFQTKLIYKSNIKAKKKKKRICTEILRWKSDTTHRRDCNDKESNSDDESEEDNKSTSDSSEENNGSSFDSSEGDNKSSPDSSEDESSRFVTLPEIQIEILDLNHHFLKEKAVILKLNRSIQNLSRAQETRINHLNEMIENMLSMNKYIKSNTMTKRIFDEFTEEQEKKMKKNKTNMEYCQVCSKIYNKHVEIYGKLNLKNVRRNTWILKKLISHNDDVLKQLDCNYSCLTFQFKNITTKMGFKKKIIY